MTESEATRDLCARIRNRGWSAQTLAGGVRYQASGLPDRLVCTPDGLVLLEFKSAIGQLSTLQRLTIKQLRAIRSDSAYVVRFSVDWKSLTIEDEEGTQLASCENSPDGLREALRVAREGGKG